MIQIPRAPLILGLAGLVPFLWGAATMHTYALSEWGRQFLGSRFVGPYARLSYGAVILSFMSGLLWGFATRAKGTQATMRYVLSAILALWAFFMTGGGLTSAALNLIIGFVGLLMLDFSVHRWGLTPPWWMQLRLLLTAIVVTCLTITVI